ncbi:hypothetical protein DPMN_054780 [Dreissena polymorpha]|uniref:Uncharacterized protein n=1 Tax=Dreissena polymorpha TaxID=45954 RepID=A0A9D4HTE3_DREPO|nr:hypothetical protein DPMN_054780 [Dreissena polymorpha]
MFGSLTPTDVTENDVIGSESGRCRSVSNVPLPPLSPYHPPRTPTPHPPPSLPPLPPLPIVNTYVVLFRCKY